MRITDEDVHRPNETFLSPLNVEVEVDVSYEGLTSTRYYYFTNILSTAEITQKIRAKLAEEFSSKKEISFSYRLYDIG